MNQLIFVRSDADLSGVVDTASPVGIREDGGKMVVDIRATGVLQCAAPDRLLGIDRVDACHIQGYRVEGCKHANIRYDGQIIFRMAVAVGGDIDDKADVEMLSALQNGLAVFGDLVVQNLVGFVLGRTDGVFGTDSDAAATAYAFVQINGSLFVCDRGCAMGTDFYTLSAAHAQILIHVGFACRVHLHGNRSPCRYFSGRRRSLPSHAP